MNDVEAPNTNTLANGAATATLHAVDESTTANEPSSVGEGSTVDEGSAVDGDGTASAPVDAITAVESANRPADVHQRDPQAKVNTPNTVSANCLK